MSSERKRLLELALDALESKKRKLDQEIEDISRELRGIRGKGAASSTSAKSSTKMSTRKKPSFSKEERLRRSERMKAYWEKWRKQKAKAKAK